MSLLNGTLFLFEFMPKCIRVLHTAREIKHVKATVAAAGEPEAASPLVVNAFSDCRKAPGVRALNSLFPGGNKKS